MSVADKLEKLARLVPGVAGYQDAEKARTTDKMVRLRLTEAIEGLKREVEAEQRRSVNNSGEYGLSAPNDRLNENRQPPQGRQPER
jgi:hypothetical protein